MEDPVLAALMKFDVNGDGLTKEEFNQASIARIQILDVFPKV